jgi:hypothetical protein
MRNNILDLTYLLFCAPSNEFVIFIETEKTKKVTINDNNAIEIIMLFCIF